MSASDSDSIDWLASDDDDSESASESVYKGGAGTTKTPPSPASSGAEPRVAQPRPQAAAAESDCSSVREGAGGWDGGARSAEPRGGNGRGLLLLGQEAQCGPLWRSTLYVPDGLPGEGPRRAPKRPRSTEVQVCWPWQHPVRTSNDELFARKCSELQCYVPHLSSILTGLQSGRYRERLSSFQESVAMDRIQRIMGVLQNPCMGERYINIILKVEEMLRSWFPNVKPKERLGGEQTDETTPSKRLKPCPATTAECPADLAVSPSNKAFGVSEPAAPGVYSATHLKWLHTSPICSPSAQRALGRLRRWRAEAEAAAGAGDVTQDSSVSSSTDPPPGAAQRRPPGKIVAPCLERLLKSTESIVTARKSAPGALKESG